MITPADSEYHNVRARRSLRLANTNTHTHTHTHTHAHTQARVFMFCFLFFSVWGKWLIWNHTYSSVSPGLKILRRRRRISVMLSSVLVTDHVLMAGGEQWRTCRKPTKAQGRTYKLRGHSHTEIKSLQTLPLFVRTVEASWTRSETSSRNGYST